MRVDVYFNIHKSRQEGRKIYSVKDKKTNRVVKHLSGMFFVKGAKLIVSKKGRERVVSEGKKNVHAFVRGELIFDERPYRERSLTYNPYKHESFVDTVSYSQVFESDLVYFDKDGTIYYR